MDMSRIKLGFSLVVMVFVLNALVSASASAATAGWMVNGALLSGSKALATTAKTDESFKLTGAGLTITCSGSTVSSLAPEISSPSMGTFLLVFVECIAVPPCFLIVTGIRTVTILTETTLQGSQATVTTLKPKTGTTFSTFAVEGETCAAAGNVAVNGQAKILAPEGQIENTLQLQKAITTEASKELFIGKTAASLSGSALLKLASGERWSFL
jgi:hypothetical protein